MTENRSESQERGEVSAATSAPLSADQVVEFWQRGEFAAFDAATAWLARGGYSVGRMQRGSPCGVLHGHYDIAKWRNLRPKERAALDGTLSGNFRDGPVVVRLRIAATPPASTTNLGPASGSVKDE